MKKILALTAGILLMSATLYAGNGDLVVNSKIGVGTNPITSVDVYSNSSPTIRVNNGSSSGYSQVTLGNTTNSYLGQIFLNGASQSGYGGANSLNIWEGGNYPIVFFSNGYERVRITGDGNVGIGASSWAAQYKLYVNGPAFSTGWLLPSDIKFKKDIKQIDSALDKINSLNGYSYLYKTDEYKDKGFPEGTQLGVIAQDIEKVIPEAVMTDEEGTKAVNYSMIIPVLIEAIKAQQAEIDELKGKTSNK